MKPAWKLRWWHYVIQIVCIQTLETINYSHTLKTISISYYPYTSSLTPILSTTRCLNRWHTLGKWVSASFKFDTYASQFFVVQQTAWGVAPHYSITRGNRENEDVSYTNTPKSQFVPQKYPWPIDRALTRRWRHKAGKYGRFGSLSRSDENRAEEETRASVLQISFFLLLNIILPLMLSFFLPCFPSC